MKIMIDTSVLISALLWPESKPAKAVMHVVKYHDLILCNHIIDEMHQVIARKAHFALEIINYFLQNLAFELVSEPVSCDLAISDAKDQPILNAAIAAKADILLSGDKHFLQLDIHLPRTMNCNQYLELYANNPEKEK